MSRSIQPGDFVDVLFMNQSGRFIIKEISLPYIYIYPENNPIKLSRLILTASGWKVDGAETTPYQFSFSAPPEKMIQIQIGDIVNIYIDNQIKEYTISKVFLDHYQIVPRDRFDHASELVKIGTEWKISGLDHHHTVQISPIELKTPEQYTQQIISTGKNYLRSPLGGMTREQLLASSLVFLRHITHDISTIVNYWKLDHRLSLSRAGIPVSPGLAGAYVGEEPSMEESAYNLVQFPGIYTAPVSQFDLMNEDFDLSFKRPGFVTLILSLSLLEQRNWHLNAKDDYGAFVNFTFSPYTLPSYLPDMKQLWGIHESEIGDYWDPEVVFHDAISLDFVEAILVQNENMKRIIERIVQGRIPVLVESRDLRRQLASMKFFKGEERLTSLPPQYCYTGIMGDWEGESPHARDAKPFWPVNQYTLEHYNKITPEQDQAEDAYIWQKRLNLCGISEKYSPERAEELFQQINDRMQAIYFDNALRTPVNPENQPPWKYTPKYYQDNYNHK